MIAKTPARSQTAAYSRVKLWNTWGQLEKKKKDQTKNNKISHNEILKYNFSVLLFSSWFSNRRCKIFQHFQVEFLGNPLVPTTEAWRKISSTPGLIWQRKESSNSARQAPKTRAWGWFWVCLNQLELYCRLQEELPGSVLPKTQGRENLSRYQFGFSPLLVKTEKSSLKKVHQLYSGISENVTLAKELCSCLKQ